MNDGFWYGNGMPKGAILFGVCGGENPNRPGIYRFSSSDGIVVNDAHVLSPDADIKGGGEHTKPRAGSTCVAVMTSDGAQCFIVGFSRSPTVDEQSNDPPKVGVPEDSDTSGDKVYKTAGGASFILKRGGSVIIEGGAGTGVILNPLNNQMSLRASNFRQNADGYLARRGRVKPGSTEPETTHEESFLHQVGPSYDRMRLTHGTLDGDARRQLELAAVKIVSSREIVTVKTRETYNSDGSWVGEGPKYQWGGDSADENAVLGKALVEALSTLIDIIKNLKVNTAWGPSTPPIPPTPIDLEKLKSSLSDKILSTFAYFSKKPPSL